MDYYSDFAMPSLEERKKSLIKYAKTITNCLDEKELDSIVTDIVSKTIDYSYTGYCVYGRFEEEEKLKKILDLKK